MTNRAKRKRQRETDIRNAWLDLFFKDSWLWAKIKPKVNA